MKSYSTASAHPPAKRRWTCFSVTVPVIVFLSLVGTVSVLLGLHNRFPTGYTTEDSSSLGNTFANAVKIDGTENQKKGHEKRINELVDRFKPTLSQADDNNITGKADVGLHKDNNNPQGTRGNSISPPKDATSNTKPGNVNSKGPRRSHGVSSDAPSVPNSRQLTDELKQCYRTWSFKEKPPWQTPTAKIALGSRAVLFKRQTSTCFSFFITE